MTRPRSITEILLHERCPRAWWYRHVQHIKPPPTPAVLRGIAIHEHLASHYSNVPMDPIKYPELRNALRLIYPPRQDGLSIERKLETRILDQVFIGYADVVNEGTEYIDQLGKVQLSHDVPEVLDYKTGASTRYWKSGADLRRDWQLLLYAYALFPMHDRVRVSHVCLQTKEPYDACKASAIVTKAEIATWRESELEPALVRLLATEQCTALQDTPVKLSGCSAYGGCPHESYCTKRQSGAEIASDLWKSLIQRKEIKLGWKEELEKRKSSSVKELQAKADADAKARAEASEVVVLPTPSTYYFDCVPSTPVAYLDGYVQRICTEIAKLAELPDIRCGQGDHPLAFGRWRGALAASIRENPPPQGDWLLLGCDHEIRQVVKETLKSLGRWVEGV